MPVRVSADAMRIRTKTALTLATLSVSVLLAISLFTFNFARNELTSNALRRLETAASTHASRLREILDHDRELTLLISSQTELGRSLDAYLTTNSQAQQATIKKILVVKIDQSEISSPISGHFVSTGTRITRLGVCRSIH